MGSGFFCATERNYMIITAHHVAVGFNTNTEVMFHSGSNAPTKILLQNVIPKGKKLIAAQDEVNDVAILHVAPQYDRDIGIFSTILAWPAKNIPTTISAPERNAPLVMFGFPQGLGALGKDISYAAISRSGKPSSGLLDLTGRYVYPGRMFIIEAPSVGGFSGGPVFDLGEPRISGNNNLVIGGSPVACVGIVSGNFEGDKMGIITPIGHAGKLIQSLLNLP